MAIELQGAKQQPVQLEGTTEPNIVLRGSTRQQEGIGGTLRTSAAIALEDWSGVWAFNGGEIIGWYYDSQYKLRGRFKLPALEGTAT